MCPELAKMSNEPILGGKNMCVDSLEALTPGDKNERFGGSGWGWRGSGGWIHGLPIGPINYFMYV